MRLHALFLPRILARFSRIVGLGVVVGLWLSAPLAWAEPMTQAQVILHGHVIVADVADTPPLQTRGLGGRASLPPDRGMLFPYATSERHAFWMKAMRFPIDIIWIHNNTVVHVEENVPAPAPGTPDSQLPTYQPSQPANMVLELAAGRARALGLKVGDTVTIRF